MGLLGKTLEEITVPNERIKIETREKWDGLFKPIGSLGDLEEISIKISGITGKIINRFDKKIIVVMCSDNGIVEEGVSSAPQFFTKVLAQGMAEGITGVATIAKFTNADIIAVDLGIVGDVEDFRVINKKIASGTKNFIKGPAMTYEESVMSIETGIEVADKLFAKGYDILGTGEIGIGNTTTASAVAASITNIDVDLISGKGGGITKEQFDNKKEIIRKGIEINKPDKDDPIDAIAKVGGFDIGGMCGLFLSAAKNKKPIVMDGFISSVAALCAVRLNPLVKEYIIPSHLSAEPGAKYIFEELGLTPIVNLGMRLGEGSGCPFSFQIIEASMFTLENMGTFKNSPISSEPLVNIRDN